MSKEKKNVIAFCLEGLQKETKLSYKDLFNSFVLIKEFYNKKNNFNPLLSKNFNCNKNLELYAKNIFSCYLHITDIVKTIKPKPTIKEYFQFVNKEEVSL